MAASFISDTYGGDAVSTWIAKPDVHVEDVAHLVNHAANFIVSNDPINRVSSKADLAPALAAAA